MSNKLMKNLLKIHELIDTMDSFIPIKVNVDNLDEKNPVYRRIVSQTNILVSVLEAFSKPMEKNYGKEK